MQQRHRLSTGTLSSLLLGNAVLLEWSLWRTETRHVRRVLLHQSSECVSRE